MRTERARERAGRRGDVATRLPIALRTRNDVTAIVGDNRDDIRIANIDA